MVDSYQVTKAELKDRDSGILLKIANPEMVLSRLLCEISLD